MYHNFISTVSRTIAEYHRLQETDWKSEYGFILPSIPSRKFLWLRSMISWIIYTVGILLIPIALWQMVYWIGDALITIFPVNFVFPGLFLMSLILMVSLPIILIPIVFHKPARIIVDFYILKSDAVVQRTYQPGEDKDMLPGHSLILILLADGGLFISGLIGFIMPMIILVVRGLSITNLIDSMMAIILSLFFLWSSKKIWQLMNKKNDDTESKYVYSSWADFIME